MKLARVFFIFVLTLVVKTTLSAAAYVDLNNYRRFIIDVDSWNSSGNVGTRFQLSDYTEWYLSDTSYLNGTQPFLIGTEVFVESAIADTYQDEYWIRFPTYDGWGLTHAWMTADSLSLLPVLLWKDLILVKEATWLTPAEYLYVWQLSDGTRWAIRPESTGFYNVDLWNIGDHIQISAKYDSGYGDWVFINADRTVPVSNTYSTMHLDLEADPYLY